MFEKFPLECYIWFSAIYSNASDQNVHSQSSAKTISVCVVVMCTRETGLLVLGPLNTLPIKNNIV